MSIFDIMDAVENQGYRIELSLAVLEEIESYFIRRDQFVRLPDRAEHIFNLLYVTEGILRDTMPELRKAVDALMEKHKEETGGKTD